MPSTSEPQTFRIDLQAEVYAGLVPDLYIGLFASISIIAKAEVYVALRAGLHVSARFDYRIALGTADVLQPLPSTCISQYGTALIGCNSGCFSEHDTRLQMFIGGRFWLGYKLYAQAGFSVFQVKIGSSTEWSVDISSLNWDRYLGALCYYFFPPSPPPPPPSPPPSPLPPPPPHHQENVVVIIAAGSGALAVLLLATYLRYTGRL